MDEQSKQDKKKKWRNAYLNIYSGFLFFSSLFCVVKFLSNIDFLDGFMYTIATYGFYIVHICSFILLMVHGKEATLKDENEKYRKYF